MGDVQDAYRAIVTGGAEELSEVLAAGPGIDIFDLAARPARVTPALVFDDRTRFPGDPVMRRWRATLQIQPADPWDDFPLDKDQVLVLSDAAEPLGVSRADAGLLRPLPATVSSLATELESLFQMIRRFAVWHGQLVDQGATQEQIIAHPQMRQAAGAIHARSLVAAAGYREGLRINVNHLAPPPGARQLAPATWFPRHVDVAADALPPFAPAEISPEAWRPTRQRAADPAPAPERGAPGIG